MSDAGAVTLGAPVEVAGARAALAAADEVLRRRVMAILERGGATTVVSASSGEELVQRCLDEVADVVVLGCDAGALSRTGELALVRLELSDWPIVVVSPRADRVAARKALRAGAQGLVAEACVEQALLITLGAVLAGQICVPKELQAQLAPPALTHREKQVLELVAQGLTNQEIGAQLYLAESTVKSHISSSFRKLGVASRAEAAAAVLDPETAVALGLRTGLGSSDPGLLLTTD